MRLDLRNLVSALKFIFSSIEKKGEEAEAAASDDGM